MKTALEQLKEKLLKNNGYKREINKQDLSFEIAESIIDARIKKGMTQKELAKKFKTKQSGIARLESGKNYPSFKSLEKIAKILDIKIKNPLFLEELKEKVAPAFISPVSWLANSNLTTNSSIKELKLSYINH
jgi:ribosome-binding protein aMBF1 (putative translation factor)